MLKIIKSKNEDFFNTLCSLATDNAKKLPEKIEWIEPSINMLYIESLSSFVYGNYFSSIISMGILLEHILRLAIYDAENTGLNRLISIEELDKFGSIAKLIKKANECDLIENDDLSWWNRIAKIIRNKSAHYLLPILLKEFTRTEYDEKDLKRKDYHPDNYKLTDKNGNPQNWILHDWGSFFHKSDKYIAEAFLRDAHNYILKLIKKTNWTADRSWWISQEYYYDSFFNYDWSFDNMVSSLKKYYTEV